MKNEPTQERRDAVISLHDAFEWKDMDAVFELMKAEGSTCKSFKGEDPLALCSDVIRFDPHCIFLECCTEEHVCAWLTMYGMFTSGRGSLTQLVFLFRYSHATIQAALHSFHKKIDIVFLPFCEDGSYFTSKPIPLYLCNMHSLHSGINLPTLN